MMSPMSIQAETVSRGLTARAASFAVGSITRWPDMAIEVARLSMLDWATVAFAGKNEPVSHIVRRFATDEGGVPVASVVGGLQRVAPRAAALTNGACSHALDYDDTHFDFVGHPSVAVLPAVLAVAEHMQATGQALVQAYLVGVETACRLGGYLGRKHYNAGFHQTATAGSLGAAAACARLLGLNESQASHALGLAATRASGLKSQFGSMGKPYHAGMAASNGVEVAMLAALGFQSRPDGIECAAGFCETHQAEGGDPSSAFNGLPENFRFVNVQHKFHACCHGTHATLEALHALRRSHPISPDEVRHIDIAIHPQWLPVCCIPDPCTGLEAKFSLAHVSALTIVGEDTANIASFNEANCRNPAIRALARRVHIVGDASLPDTAARVTVGMATSSRSATVDLAEPLAIEIRTARVRAKSQALLGTDRAERLWREISSIGDVAGPSIRSAIRSILFCDEQDTAQGDAT